MLYSCDGCILSCVEMSDLVHPLFLIDFPLSHTFQARAMPRCSNLQLLDLSENEAPLVENSHVESARCILYQDYQDQANLSDAQQVSDVGAERFAAALPKCGQLQRPKSNLENLSVSSHVLIQYVLSSQFK